MKIWIVDDASNCFILLHCRSGEISGPSSNFWELLAVGGSFICYLDLWPTIDSQIYWRPEVFGSLSKKYLIHILSHHLDEIFSELH